MRSMDHHAGHHDGTAVGTVVAAAGYTLAFLTKNMPVILELHMPPIIIESVYVLSLIAGGAASTVVVYKFFKKK